MRDNDENEMTEKELDTAENEGGIREKGKEEQE